MIEEWKDIQGYEGLYQISNLGRVKSLKYGKEKILSCGVHKNGYLFVNLYKNCKSEHFFIHRLVAQEFVPNPDPENKNFVDHINTIKNNNRSSNLRWVTRSENNNNEITKQKISLALKGKTLSEETKQKLSLANKGKNLGKKLSEETKQKMSLARKGKCKHNKGKHWKLVDGKRVWY